MRTSLGSRTFLPLLLLNALPARVLAGDVLSTDGFSTCIDNPTISVTALNIQYDRSTGAVNFDVAGSSSEVQNVTATMIVTAYGKEVYSKSFNPCDKDTLVEQLCPVPAGNFSAVGSQDIPSSYTSVIPSIAFSVPDLDGSAKLELKSAETGQDLACIQSTVTNGKTMNVPAVSYVAVGIAGAALALSAAGAIASAGHPGSTAPSPTFFEVVGWFQGVATNGMLSVKYPSVYQSFTKNFAFSTGLVPWGSMQNTIDTFRQRTGGNLTDDSYEYLKNATLVYTSDGNSSSVAKRSLDAVLEASWHYIRDVTTDVNGTSTSTGASSTTTNTSSSDNKVMHYVSGIQAYVEQLTIPQANTFMTVLLIFAIVIAAITVGILLLKVILELFALMGNLPHALNSFRKRYWWRLDKAIVNLILLLYGIWTLYCVYQFTNGDSWAAKVLAGISWSLFTIVLAFFTFKIWSEARKYKKLDGDARALYENKETWMKYSLFYDAYKKGYWWLFVPAIIYMFARNTVIAAANGHGLVQTIGQMAVEILMLILLLWSRPYQMKSGNWINIIIQIVRVLSVVCILVFVEELGISQSTKTITGVVLIVVQSVLTGLLAILIGVNAIIACVRENPHRKRRKEAEKLNRDLDNLTPLDARNSLLMEPHDYKPGTDTIPDVSMAKAPLVSPSLHHTTTNTSNYSRVGRDRDHSPSILSYYARERSESRGPVWERPGLDREESRARLMDSAADMGGRERWERSQSPPEMREGVREREPRLPDVGGGFGRAY